MSNKKQREALTVAQKNAVQWLRDKAIHYWLAGKWDAYAHYIQKADRITRRG